MSRRKENSWGGCAITGILLGGAGCSALALAVSVFQGVRDPNPDKNFLAPSTPAFIEPTTEPSQWYQQPSGQSGMETWRQDCGTLGEVLFQCAEYCTGNIENPTTSQRKVSTIKRGEIARYCAER